MPPSFPIAPTPGPPVQVPRGWIRGRVAGFQPRNELRGSTYITIWSFRVEQRGGLPPVALEMRGYAFEGSITNGDEVQVRAVSGQQRPQRVSSLVNISSNATVRVTKKPGSWVVAILVLGVLVAFGWLVIGIVLPGIGLVFRLLVVLVLWIIYLIISRLLR